MALANPPVNVTEDTSALFDCYSCVQPRVENRRLLIEGLAGCDSQFGESCERQLDWAGAADDEGRCKRVNLVLIRYQHAARQYHRDVTTHKVQRSIEWEWERRFFQLRTNIGSVTSFDGQDGARSGQIIFVHDGSRSAEITVDRLVSNWPDVRLQLTPRHQRPRARLRA